MNPIEYELVFDVARTGYQGWSGWAYGLTFVAIGIGFVFYRDRLARYRHPRFALVFTVGMLIFSVLWTIVGCGGNYSQYARIRDARAAHTYSIVEGRVEKFEPMPYAGHRRESFVVGGTRFEYSDYELVSSFHNTASHGGPIYEGLRVRIGHVRGEIVTLEIERRTHDGSTR